MKSAEKITSYEDTIRSDSSANNDTNSQSESETLAALLIVNATAERAGDPTNKENHGEYKPMRTAEELVWVLDDLEYAMTHKVDHTKAIVRKQAVPFSLLDLGSFFAVVIVISIVMSFTIMESHHQA
eukprot:TRINITY_DN1056_c0_g2_i1.p1 TRINITY_DN1056_c0_g2~~TRINITY_DN1056_c0_g2_i1.p1  ORF type:complete len:127 (+),score=8.80 TRINITY_DN1056_c0_g2_i1:367-747(+)